MPTRRQCGQLLAAVLLPMREAMAEDNALSPATEFIRRSGNQVASLASGAKNSDEQLRRLQAFIDDVVDVGAVARFCLGRFWRLATPAQQQEYVELFHQVLMNNVTARVGDYPQGGVKVTINTPERKEGGIYVSTTVERSPNPPVHVVWVVSMDGGRPRIIDLVAEGVSLRVTLRSDFTAFIQRHNNEIDALVNALRQQAAKSG
jgi:phospholipid transport system substrate-binding protein